MNLKLIWLLFGLWQKLKNLKVEDFKMGWKTITGTILAALGMAGKALSGVDPIFDTIGDILIAIGVALGGIGIRAAISKTNS